MIVEVTEAACSAVDGAAPDRQRRQPGEPIAIVGVGLRFPGGSESLDEFSRFLAEGRSGISPIPTDRWDVEAFTPTDPTERGKIRTSGGGFLDHIDQFDPVFFNISPKEAQYMDPQQRMLLETAWQALEHANIDPAALRRGNGGVYIGASSIDYALELDSLPYAELDGLLASGITMFPLSGRLSYFLGWRGPSASIDTACSSSLTALHMAVQALRAGECDIALCGGVNALHHPRIPVMFSHAQMLAPDGRCKTFDDAADGYVRAEGCAVIVLKRLSLAQRDGNQVLAIIRGTAVGQDGDSAGLTVPNGAAQEIVMRNALAAAGLTPGDIQYVEAHGTGTPLGDPIELGAINDVFVDSHDKDRPLMVGSVKTNLGHMEPASGLVGLIKVVAQLREAIIYPHLNLSTPSKRIPWERYPIEVPTTARGWAAPVRRALVNSFGFAGTIAAVALEQAPDPEPAGSTDDWSAPARSAVPSVLAISAKSAAAMTDQLRNYADHVNEHPNLDITDLCFSAAAGRSHFKYRMAAVVTDRDSVLRALERELAHTDRPEPRTVRKVAFLFSGQGSQYPGMAAGLYAAHPEFARRLDECDRLFTPVLGRAMRDLLLDPDSSPELLNQTRYTQPALFCLEYSLAMLWMSWGIQPGVLIGHSIGEVVAATVAGVFELADAVTLVAARGRLMQSVRTPGGMAAVSLSVEEAAPLLADRPELAVAAVNAPDQCVLSGGSDALAEVCRLLRERDVRVDQLPVSHAFHSPLMAEVYEQFRSELAGLRLSEPTLPVISNVTGAPARRGELTDPEYWVGHIGRPVLFQAGLTAAIRRGRHALIEIGPSGSLLALGRRCLGSDEHLWLASASKRDRGPAPILRALAEAYRAGLPIRWQQVFAGRDPRWLTLPSYPFQRRRYWLPNSPAGKRAGGGDLLGQHPLLGGLAGGAAEQAGPVEFAAEYTADLTAYLAEYRVSGSVRVPVAAYLEAILAAQDAITGRTDRLIEEFTVLDPLVLTEVPVQVRIGISQRDQDDALDVRIESVADHGRIVHAEAMLRDAPFPPLDLPATEATVERVAAADLYLDLDSVDRQYGQRFRLLKTVDCHPDGSLTAELSGRPAGAVEQLPVEILQAALQALAAVDLSGVSREITGLRAMRLIKKPRGERLRIRAQVRADPTGPAGARSADLRLSDSAGPVAELAGVRLAEPADDRHGFEHVLVWQPDEGATADAPPADRRAVLINAAVLDPTAELGCIELTGLDGLAEALADPAVTDVWWCWRGSTGTVTAETLRTECETNFRELLRLVAILEASPPSRRLRLSLVTSGAQLLDGQSPGDDSMAAASLWGFGRVLRNEYPRYRTRLIDLDPAQPADGLRRELALSADDESQLAYRAGQRQVRRLMPRLPAADRSGPGAVTGSAAEPPPLPRLRPDRTYLITGGLGGLGLVTARKLVELGATNLALVSRRGVPTPEAAHILDQLAAEAKVRLIAADLGSAADVERMIGELAGGDFPLGGVVHAAGEIGKDLIGNLSWEAIERQIAPKIYGGWLLHQATSSIEELDFFVVYTSIAGIIGGLTQAHYAAASSYLDELARRRRAQGLPGLAINWGAWAGVGMSARLDEGLSRQVEAGGIRFFSPGRALRGLANALAGEDAQRILGEYDWEVIAGAGSEPDPLYAELAAQATVRTGASFDVAALAGRPTAERRAALSAAVAGIIAGVLQFEDLAALDRSAEFGALGLDSLMAMDVKRGLEAAFGLSLPVSAAYDHPTIEKMTRFVDIQLGGSDD